MCGGSQLFSLNLALLATTFLSEGDNFQEGRKIKIGSKKWPQRYRNTSQCYSIESIDASQRASLIILTIRSKVGPET